jgi:F-box domain
MAFLFWNSRARLGFKDLPLELVLEISTYLPELDRLCLALTCKSLLEILDGDKALQRSPIFRATATFPDRSWNRRYTYKIRESPRWELLRRMGNLRWIRCIGCFKLHPRRHPAQGWFPEYYVCSTFAGVARLCPCIEITFQDKKKLVKALLSPRENADHYRIKNSVIELAGSKGHHHCFHAYELGGNDHVTMHCKLTLSVEEENDNNFIVETEYQISLTSFSWSFSPGDMQLCPHRNVRHHVYELEKRYADHRMNHNGIGLSRALHGRVWHYTEGSLSCPWCQTTVFNALWSFMQRTSHGIRPDCITLTSRRCFGTAMGEADDAWYHQTETEMEDNYWRPRHRRIAYHELHNRSWISLE